MSTNSEFQDLAINTIRFLSADAVQQANSGHPGLPMGDAAIAFTIWSEYLHHNPKNPKWPGRDRFILSGGHGSMLLYSLLYLTGYGLTLEELKNFRQWGSRTPGHPEYGLTPGVETTTGPLGQGFANGVGMAIAATHLGAEFNRPGFDLIDPYIYAIVTDGDLMEGVTSEAASLAGHLKLKQLIYFYDDNRISIDGSTEIAFTEDRGARFKAYGWHVSNVQDGNNYAEISQAIRGAQDDPRPSLIICRTIIGYGLPTRQGTPQAHGEPPGEDELAGAKRSLGWPVEDKFFVPEDVLNFFRQAIQRGEKMEREWEELFQTYQTAYPDLAAEFKRRFSAELHPDWDSGLKLYPADTKGMATRAASGKAINALAAKLPELIGGSADLAPSNKTWIDGSPAFQKDTPEGRNLHFGVRENAMGSIVNGMAVFGGLIPYGGTFLVFSDYMRPAIRLSALSHYPSIWVFTHDSVGVGEDGPTHQPVEHIAALRAIPNLVVLRPGDANEVNEAWRFAITRRDGPTALILSRQNMPTLDRNIYPAASELNRGAYVLADMGESEPEIILMASGSEVGLALGAAGLLAAEGVNTRVVSFPSWELFAEQDRNYQEAVFPKSIKARLAIEAGVSAGWYRWVGSDGGTVTVDHFGASAPADVVYKKFGLTVENIVKQARQLLGRFT